MIVNMHHTWENFGRGKIGEFGKSRAIRHHFPCQYPDLRKTYMAYALTVAYLPIFSSPTAFTFMVHQNFPPPNIPIYGITIIAQP